MPTYKKILKIAIFFILFSVFQACQEVSKEDTPQIKEKTTLTINEGNYIQLSKYHYIRQKSMLSQKKSRDLKEEKQPRSHPGAKKQIENNHNTITIKTIAPFEKYLEQIIITQNKTTVQIDINNKQKNVSISFNDGKQRIEKNMTLDKFLQLNKGLEL